MLSDQTSTMLSDYGPRGLIRPTHGLLQGRTLIAVPRCCAGRRLCLGDVIVEWKTRWVYGRSTTKPEGQGATLFVDA